MSHEPVGRTEYVVKLEEEAKRLRHELEELRELMRAFGSEEAIAAKMRDVAERQREACADLVYEGPQDRKLLEDFIRATPLVTEETP